MYHFAAPPPDGAWEKIAGELDNVPLHHPFIKKMQTLAVQPNATSWQFIALALDEEKFKNDYQQKLSGLAVTPPSSVWDKIATGLSLDTTVTHNRKNKISVLLRYAAAACVLALLAWGAYFFLNKNTKNEIPIAKQTDTTVEKKLPVPNYDIAKVLQNENVGIEGITASVQEARNDAALEASKKTYAVLDKKIKDPKIKNAADFFFMPERDEPGVRGLGDWTPPQQTNNPDRYFTLITPEGHIIRISKKLGDMVGCVAGAEQDIECLEQLKKWRAKLANPKLPSSSANFMEILNLAKSLED